MHDPRPKQPLAPVAALCLIVFAMLAALGSSPAADAFPGSGDRATVERAGIRPASGNV